MERSPESLGVWSASFVLAPLQFWAIGDERHSCIYFEAFCPMSICANEFARRFVLHGRKGCLVVSK